MFKSIREKLLGKSGDIDFLSPVSGMVVSIKEVSDPTFSEEILGKGVAIIPSDNVLCSPLDGVIENMFETAHAVTLFSNNGVEVLLHIGIDTIKLKGNGFKALKQSDDIVSAGDALIEFDSELIKVNGYDDIVCVIITNSEDEYKIIEPIAYGEVTVGETLFKVRKI